jgi:hypothetical protein
VTSRRPRVHIVVTCANRKRQPVPAKLRLRGVTGLRTTTRLNNWTQRLTSTDVDTVRAEDLYAGEHWDVARNLPTYATGFAKATLWVASAGWGLIPATAQIRPYSATFSPGHLDSVPDGRRGAQDWWNAVAAWSGPETLTPRSLTALVAEYPRDRILLVLSQSYFAACTDDLAGALDMAASDSLISVVAAGVATNPDLAAWQLPANALLQHQLGGTRGSLNARIAAHLLSTGLIDHAAMRRHLSRMLAKAPSLPVYARHRMTDAEVGTFIRSRRAQDATVSRTGLLRDLRNAGMACEQGRFSDIYAATAGGKS